MWARSRSSVRHEGTDSSSACRGDLSENATDAATLRCGRNRSEPHHCRTASAPTTRRASVARGCSSDAVERCPCSVVPGSFRLVAIAVPSVREGTVVRTDLVERLVGSNSMRVVLILAGPGYGKSTLLAQWAAADDRPFAWLSMSPELRDPVVLLARSPTRSTRSSPLTRRHGRGWSARTRTTRVSGCARTGAGGGEPKHPVRPRGRRRALAVVSTGAGRADGALHVGARRIADRDRIARDLGINVGGLRGEAPSDHRRREPRDERSRERPAAAQSRLDLSEDDVSLLVERTEGWPVALYLTALALRQGDDPAAFGPRVRG